MHKKIIAVIGDVHHHLWLAVDELTRLEESIGRAIDQVLSVGDFGLFLEAEDWEFLTGPDRYKRTEQTERIFEAWQKWRWPLAMIGGNHEPFNRLREWDPAYYDYRLEYTHAGELRHQIAGLRVYGLTGISGAAEPGKRKRVEQWPEIMEGVRTGERSIRELVNYRKPEVDHLLALPHRPHILLTHDWPVARDDSPSAENRPERLLLETLEPEFHFAGHHHTHHVRQIGKTRFEALNIIHQKNNPYLVTKDWCRLLEWDGKHLGIFTP